MNNNNNNSSGDGDGGGGGGAPTSGRRIDELYYPRASPEPTSF